MLFQLSYARRVFVPNINPPLVNKSFSKKSKSSNNNNSFVEFPKLLKLKIPENCKQTASGYVNKKPAMIYPKLTYYQGSLIKDNNGTGFLRETEIPDKNLTTYKVGQYDDYLNHAAGPGSMNNSTTSNVEPPTRCATNNIVESMFGFMKDGRSILEASRRASEG